MRKPKVNKDHKSNSYIISFSYRDRHGVRRRFRRSAGRGVNKCDARSKADALYLEMEKGPLAFVERFVAPAQNKKKALPFERVATHYFEEHVQARCRPSTRRTHEQILRVHLVPAFGGKDLRDIRRQEVHGYVSVKLRSKPGPATALGSTSCTRSPSR